MSKIMNFKHILKNFFQSQVESKVI